jgi:hypothetical protein
MNNEKINVICQTCNESDFDTRDNLEKSGWLIEKDYQLCPNDFG